MHCNYYQAKVLKEKTWFLSGCLRNEDNLVFARALENNPDTFEFFVTPIMEEHFLGIIDYLKRKGCILSFEKLPNRIMNNLSKK